MMDLHMNLHSNRIWLACGLRGDIPDRMKEIAGQGFDSKTKLAIEWGSKVVGRRVLGVYTFPMTYRTCLDIRAAFPDCRIVIHDELQEWATREKRKRERLAAIRKMESVPTPRIAKLYPALDEAIHKRAFQSVGVEFVRVARQAIIGDQPGLGKTLEAIGAIIEDDLKGPIVVVAPATAVVTTWPDEFDSWVPGEEYAVCEGDAAFRNATLDQFWEWARSRKDKRSWLFINAEMLQRERPPVKRRKPKAMPDAHWLGYTDIDNCGVVLIKWNINSRALGASQAAQAERDHQQALDEWNADVRRHPQLFDRLWSAVIIDESQRVLPTKASEAKDQSQLRSGAQRLLVRPNGMKIALSGTPFRGNPLNHWGTLNWLWPLQYTAYWTYVDRWFDVEESEYGKVVESIKRDQADAYGAELDVAMIRRTKREVVPWLPEKEYPGVPLDRSVKGSPVGVWLDMEPKQASAYQQMVEDAVADLDSGQLMAGGVLAEMTRCKQMACAYGDVEHVRQKVAGTDYMEWADKYRPMFPSNKWTWLLEFLAERGITHKKTAWGEDKIIIASWQTRLLDMFRAEAQSLGIPSLSITGGVTGANRAAAKKAFQAPKGPRVLFLNTFAGGVSLTLDVADEMVVLDETWVPDDQEQLEDRIDRISRGEGRPPSTFWYVRSRGTIEERIAAMSLGKDSLQKQLMDGRRGVPLAKRLLIGD